MKKVYVVGMGPGSQEQMTEKAREVFASCEVIAGYTVYVELLKKPVPGQNISPPQCVRSGAVPSGLRVGSKRKTTAMVCSGDAGIYGMAGLMYEVGGGVSTGRDRGRSRE